MAGVSRHSAMVSSVHFCTCRTPTVLGGGSPGILADNCLLSCLAGSRFILQGQVLGLCSAGG